MKNDVKFAINAQIGEYFMVEDDDVVVEIEVLEVLDVVEVQFMAVLVEVVDNDVHDVQPFDVTVEKVVAEKVRTIVMVVDDDEVVVDDEYIETVVIDETVDIMD